MADIVINGVTYPAPKRVAFPGSDGKPVVFDLPEDADAGLNSYSERPVQNKVIYEAVQEIHRHLTSPYNFKGSLASASALPAASAANANDTYYLIQEKYRVTSNGETWEQSSMEETDYTDELEGMEDMIGQITGNENISFVPDQWYNTTDNIDVTSPDSAPSSVTASSCAVPCAEGDQFTLTGTGFINSHKLWAFADEDGRQITRSESNASADQLLLTAPSGAAWLVVNVGRNHPHSLLKNELVKARLDRLEHEAKEACFAYTDFSNGNINPSTGRASTANRHPLISSFIDIDAFVSINVSGRDDASGNNYSYQLFAYDAAYGYLGYGNTSHLEETTTRQMVLDAYPTTRYVRLKVSGGDPDVQLDAGQLDAYGYEGYIRATPGDAGQSGEDENFAALIEGLKGDDGSYDTSFAVRVALGLEPQIVTISGQYTGTAPTIQFSSLNAATDGVLWRSPVYELGGGVEPTRRSWRLPPASGPYTTAVVSVTIPEGTSLDILSAELRGDQRCRFADAGIRYHGHAGYLAPANTSEAFQRGAELGYNSMITIPKFTSDGVAVCFHDDGSISGGLCRMDGTAITGEDDRGVSTYTYGELTASFRLKSLEWGVLHVPPLEEFFRVCSLTGMAPILSVHSTGFGMAWDAGFRAIRTLAKKWGVLHKLWIKGGNGDMQRAARTVFGTDIGGYIFLSGQSHAPFDWLTVAKSCGFVAADATDLSGCDYNLVCEYFYAQTVSGASYYADTMASIATELARGFAISVATTGTYGISGPEMERLIGLGVTEFTVDHHISMGLSW